MRVPSVPSPVVGLAKGPQRAYLDLSGATAWDISPVGRRGNLDLMQYALIFFDVQLILAQMPLTLALSQREGGTLSCAPSAVADAGNGRPLSWALSADAVAGGGDRREILSGTLQ